MKMIKLFSLSLLLVVLFTACSTQGNPLSNGKSFNADDFASVLQVDEEGNTKINGDVLNRILGQASSTELSVDEISGIKFMLEEEKLARDVYTKLYEKWGQQNFTNISKSEGAHIAAVRALADKYSIDVSFYNDEVGKFTDEKLAGLFNNLVATGNNSLEEALKVGALIEEIDILDLEEYSSQTLNEDLLLVYDNLMRGSRNHLRSFVRTMSRQGWIYGPQRLSEEDYNSIINSENERGAGQETGNPGGNGQGQGNSQSQGNGGQGQGRNK